MLELELFAPCPFGMESLTTDELKRMHIKRVRPLKGGVAFYGELEDAYRACLWSRCASRIQLVLSRVSASDAQALYDGVRAIAWEQHIPVGATIAVNARGTNDELRNTQFSGLKVKDAVCDRLRELRGSRPDVNPGKPDVLIAVAVHGRKATVSIDLAGESLHRRGYRREGVQAVAPLKEALAAGVVYLSGFPDALRRARKAQTVNEVTFIDPMCGSATLAIEAAMMAADMAPGLLRQHWGFTGWAGHDEELFTRLLDEADTRMEAGLEDFPRIYGFDIDERCIEIARNCARDIGFADKITFDVADVRSLDQTMHDHSIDPNSSGYIVTNPPYGERLLSSGQLPALYTLMREGFSCVGPQWHVCVISPDDTVPAELDLSCDESYPLYNGRIPVTVFDCSRSDRPGTVALVLDAQTGTEVPVHILDEHSDQFASRLKKNAKLRRKWAAKNDVTCYRVYDADLPDFSAAIDIYQAADSGRRYLCIAEYRAPKTIDATRAAARLADIVAIAPHVLGVDPENVFVRRRQRDKGGSQYARPSRHHERFIVTEGGVKLFVDLSGYLDTGLFLDHRITREAVGRMAKGKRFANLFAYTGVATLHAAHHGAASTVTVDLSNTYIDWARENMRKNGFSGREHRFVRSDVSEWITAQRRERNRYDLIFVDPPTFSNSKTMGSRTWDIQRDHVELLIGVVHLLSDGGQAVFSGNLRGFKPDTDKLSRYGIELTDVTAQTIPEDFARNAKIHFCYVVTATGTKPDLTFF